jgi:hypothetical protein
MDELASELGNLRVLQYSSKTGAGREELWQEIRNAVADFRVPELGVNFG